MKRPAHVPSHWIETKDGWAHPSRVRAVATPEPKQDTGRTLEPDVSTRETIGEGVGERDGRKSGNPDELAKAFGLVVTLHVRQRGRLMDEHDNLRAACKPLVDAIAASLGVPDDDPRIRWQYSEAVTSGELGVIVMMEEK